MTSLEEVTQLSLVCARLRDPRNDHQKTRTADRPHADRGLGQRHDADKRNQESQHMSSATITSTPAVLWQ
jgi:hypothetical protein